MESATKKVGRNSPCPCGSGRKYKRCCLKGTARARNADGAPAAAPAKRRRRAKEEYLTIHDLAAFAAKTYDQVWKDAGLAPGAWDAVPRSDQDIDLTLSEQGAHIYLEWHFEGMAGPLSFRFGKRKGLIEATSHIPREALYVFFWWLMHPDPSPYQRATEDGYVEACSKVLRSLLGVTEANGEEPVRFDALVLQALPKDESDILDSRIEATLQHEYFGKESLPGEREYLWDFEGSMYSHPSSIDHSLMYLFSDGTLINAREALSHPYAVLVPEDLRLDPDDQDVFGRCAHESWLRPGPDLDDGRVAGGYSKILQAYAAKGQKDRFGRLLLAPKKKAERKSRFSGPEKRGESVSLDVFEVQELAYQRVDEFRWALRSDGMVTVSGPFPEGASKLPNDWFLNPADRRLTHVPVKGLLSESGVEDPEDEDLEDEEPDGGVAPSFDGNAYKAKLPGLPHWLNRFKERVEADGGEVVVEDLVPGCEEESRLRFRWDSQKPDRLRVQIESPLLTEESGNFVSWALRDLADHVNGNLGKLVPHAKVGAGGRDPEQRKVDLAFLRHAGAARTLLATTVAELEERAADGSSIEEMKDQVVRRVEERLRAAGLFKKGTDFASALSTELAKKLESYVSCIAEGFVNHRGHLFLVEGGLAEVDENRLVLRLAAQLIRVLSEAFGEGVFTKQSIRGLSVMHTGRGAEGGAALVIEHDRAQELVGAALSAGFPLSVDGQDVERLDPSSLTARLVADESDGEDWFDLHPQVFFDGEAISEQDARRFVDGGLVPYRGRVYYVDRAKVPTARWLDYFWTKIQGRRRTENSAFRSDGDIVQVEPSHVLNMLALKLAGMPVIGGSEWQRISRAFDRLTAPQDDREHREGELSETLSVPLKPFQEQGTRWMLDLWELGLGGVLADDMGLGKTIQTLGFLSALQRRGELGRSVIIVPPSLLYNWDSECRRFAPHLHVARFCSKAESSAIDDMASRKEGILLTTYGMVSENPDQLARIDWNVAVFDEAQNLKNIKSKRTGAARRLPAKTKFCLTGTPLENHYGEFYSLIDLCVPGALGDYTEFSETYVPKGKSAQFQISPEDVEFLRLKTAPLVLRRKKSKILDELPDKTETLIKLDFDKAQKKIYRDTALSWNKSLREMIADGGETQAQLQMLTALLRLRQICSCPQTVPNSSYKHTPPKFEQLLGAVADLVEKDEAVVVFTNFRQTLELLEMKLMDEGLFCLSLSGQTPTKKRAEILREFEIAEHPPVLLMTQKVGGVGLNLTRSSYVFHIEPWWNPQVENQATDRVHRIGQSHSVQVYRYIMAESVEERIQELKDKKAKLFGDLFECEDGAEGSSAAYASNRLSQREFEYLLS